MRLFGALLILLAAVASAATSPRHQVALASDWRFTVDMEKIGETEQWFCEDFDRSAWSKVTVPKAWDLYQEAMWGFEGVGWYAVAIPPALAEPGKLQTLRFGRVMYHTKVWLNGESLGENIGGYLPFEFDVTGKLRNAKPNVLVLRVDNKPRLQWLPASRNIEWMQYGGILGPVILETTARVFLSDLTINAVPKGAGTTVDCQVEIRSRKTAVREVTLRLAVGDAVKSAVVKLAPGATVRERVTLVLSRAGRWSPATPFLHTLRATIEHAGATIDATSTRFGVRKIETRGRDILLNGERLYLKGVNRYDEYGRYGVNAPRQLVVDDLRRMKSAGVNFVRVHFPQSPELISLYDEMGFLMMEEVTINWWGNGFSGKGEEVQRADILDYAIPFLERMVRRDKNHPSIVFWSMCNESTTDTEVGIHVMRTLIRRARELDPTRPITFVLATRESKRHLAFEDTDIVSVNVYVGGYKGKPANHVAQVRELTTKAAEEYLRRQADTWPTKPVIVTEFGTPGIPGIHGDTSHTEEYQAAVLEEVWSAIGRCKEVSGGVMWSWADYFHRPNYIKYAAFGPYGVVTVDRRPKLAFQSLVKMYGGSGKKAASAR
jgi:beta-galactosidase/beta-glucuronidase